MLVKGRSQLHQPAAARRGRGAGRGDVPEREEFDQLAEIRLWAGRTGDGSRSDLDFRPLPSVWDAVASENGNCLGRNCPRYKDCFYFKARRRMWSANILVVNHALFITDLALRRPGSGFLPDYDVAIFDEAHTLEAVAGEHLGLQRHERPGRVHARRGSTTTARARGCSSITGSTRRCDQVQRPAMRPTTSSTTSPTGRHTGASNGRLRKPIAWPDTLGEELRKLADGDRHAGPTRSRRRSSGSS